MPGLTSVVVARRGRLVAERYFRAGGADSLYALREHGAITVADLLTMRSGIDWNEGGNVAEYNGWALAPYQVEYLLTRDVVEPPGTRWNYNSGAVHLLAAAIEVNAGGAVAFADRYLLEPLGIRSRDWEIDNRASTARRLGTGTSLGSLGTLGYGDLWWLGRAGATVGATGS